jgi:hypothetical protein
VTIGGGRQAFWRVGLLLAALASLTACASAPVLTPRLTNGNQALPASSPTKPPPSDAPATMAPAPAPEQQSFRVEAAQPAQPSPTNSTALRLPAQRLTVTASPARSRCGWWAT